MAQTLRELLALERFALRLRSGADGKELDIPLSWVHSSDLPDPTPWLLPGQLLLTDGAQFTADEEDAKAAAYVLRLRRKGVLGLGFARDVVHPEIPAAVVRACEAEGLVLIEVPRRTPFMSIIRHVADDIANDRSARLSWTLDAQRAVARAAIGTDGLGEIMRVLARRLECWVALYDSAGTHVHVRGLPAIDDRVAGPVAAEVRRLLERGAPAALGTVSPAPATLQTIGQAGRLRGVLVVGSRLPQSSAEGDLVESVIALASIALEQQRALGSARRRIRTGVLELIRSGATEVAERTAAAVWGRLPRPPIDVAMLRGPLAGQSVFDELDDLALDRSSDLFYGELGEDIVLLGSADALGRVEPLRLRHSLAMGHSRTSDWGGLEAAIDEARLASLRADPRGPAVTFAELTGRGVLGLVRTEEGRSVARRVLAPLNDLPLDEADRLRDAAIAWLDVNGAWDPAARSLGIHRHTLRARIDRLGAVLGLDLETFQGRAELWAALDLSNLSSAGSRG